MKTEDLSGVAPTAMTEWLEARGWNRVPFSRSNVARYAKSGNDEIAIPLDSAFRDYPRRLLEAIELVAAVESISPSDLLTTLIIRRSDILKWRRADSAVRAGTLPLGQGIEFYEGARRILLSSAHTQLEPAKYFARLSRPEAEAFVANCRMGQTEEGSFIATVFCPIDIAPQSKQERLKHFDAMEEPFGRAVTKTVMLQMASLSLAAEKRDSALLFDEKHAPLVSGNFCEGLLRMASTGDLSEISVSVDWTDRPPLAVPVMVSIPADSLPSVEDFAKVLRPTQDDVVEEFTGKVASLSANPEKEKRDGGEIMLHAATSRGLVRAKLRLDSSSDYNRALKAHELSAVVILKGRLVKTGNRHHIDDYTDFRILGEDSGLMF